MFEKSNITTHEKDCELRNVSCIYQNCGGKIIYQGLEEHFKSSHGINLLTQSTHVTKGTLFQKALWRISKTQCRFLYFYSAPHLKTTYIKVLSWFAYKETLSPK